MPPGNGRALLGDGMAARQQPCAFWLTTLYGEPFGLNPGQDQETGVIDDELQIFESLGLLPADKALALGQFPGTRPKADQRHELLCGEDVVTDLAP